MGTREDRWFLACAGICAIAWPLLSEILFYALYPIVAGGASVPRAGGPSGVMLRLAETGQRPAVIALEWCRVAFQLLLLPFLLGLHSALSARGQKRLASLGVAFGAVTTVLVVLTHTFSPTLSHLLGQAFVDAETPGESASIAAITLAILKWRTGLNQTISLIYQCSIALFSLGLIRSHTWRSWGWLGLVGALLALPAKLSFAIRVPTNFIWTGIAYCIWPIGLGTRLLRAHHLVRDSSEGADA